MKIVLVAFFIVIFLYAMVYEFMNGRDAYFSYTDEISVFEIQPVRWRKSYLTTVLAVLIIYAMPFNGAERRIPGCSEMIVYMIAIFFSVYFVMSINTGDQEKKEIIKRMKDRVKNRVKGSLNNSTQLKNAE